MGIKVVGKLERTQRLLLQEHEDGIEKFEVLGQVVQLVRISTSLVAGILQVGEGRRT
jgi:hypothetical protein